MDFTTKFTKIDCCSCNFQFAVPEKAKDMWRDTKEFFYCPSCKQAQHFTGETDAEKYKRLYMEEYGQNSELIGRIALKDRQINGSKGAMGLLRKQRDDARAVNEAE